MLKRGVGPPEALENKIELIARANQDSVRPLKDLMELVSQAIEENPGEALTSAPPSPRLAAPQPTSRPHSKKVVFIVHGHRHGVVRGIQSALSILKEEIEIKVLSREVNKGRTIIEKFDETAQRVHFAIVVATADDIGRAAKKSRKTKRRTFEKRARQNVIFEWGYFIGRITRQSVALLYEEGVRLPSDLEGTVHIALDSRQQWKADLVKEVRASLFD